MLKKIVHVVLDGYVNLLRTGSVLLLLLAGVLAVLPFHLNGLGLYMSQGAAEGYAAVTQTFGDRSSFEIDECRNVDPYDVHAARYEIRARMRVERGQEPHGPLQSREEYEAEARKRGCLLETADDTNMEGAR